MFIWNTSNGHIVCSTQLIPTILLESPACCAWGGFVKDVKVMKGGLVKEMKLTKGGGVEDPPGRGLGGGREANEAPAQNRHQDEVPAQVRHHDIIHHDEVPTQDRHHNEIPAQDRHHDGLFGVHSDEWHGPSPWDIAPGGGVV